MIKKRMCLLFSYIIIVDVRFEPSSFKDKLF